MRESLLGWDRVIHAQEELGMVEIELGRWWRRRVWKQNRAKPHVVHRRFMPVSVSSTLGESKGSELCGGLSK
jgi:hypothetical protein